MSTGQFADQNKGIILKWCPNRAPELVHMKNSWIKGKSPRSL